MFASAAGPIETITAFSAVSKSYPASQETHQIYHSDLAAGDIKGSDNQIVFKNQVSLPDIFSEQDFLCCKKLGEKTLDQGLCCSGYAVTAAAAPAGQPALPAGTLECLLPHGTDINVYFNRYVSTEGIGTGAPGGGFEDTDFIPETGEIAWNERAMTN